MDSRAAATASPQALVKGGGTKRPALDAIRNAANRACTKGSDSTYSAPWAAISLRVGTDLASNTLKALVSAVRLRRLVGNVRALGDALIGRCRPERAVTV